MDNYESTRRNFLKKLGLTVGVATVSTGIRGAQIMEKTIEFPLTEDQKIFLNKYEIWMRNFMEMNRKRKINPNDMEANKKLMQLSEEHEKWQSEVRKHMQDQNFAKNFMIVSEKLTNEIE